MGAQQKYLFEIYLSTDVAPAEYWAKLHAILLGYLGTLGKYELIFTCRNNVVRYFIRANSDLSGLSSKLEGILLRPARPQDVSVPAAASPESGMQFVPGGSLLELREKYAIKRHRDLEIATFSVRLISHGTSWVTANLYFRSGNQLTRAHKVMHFFPAHLFATDFRANSRYLKRELPKYLNIERAMHMLMSNNVGALFKVDTFPYFSHDYFLNLTSYDFDKHSLIVGASGSGKSKLISLMIDRLSHTTLKMNYRVVVIDPHAALAEDVAHIPQRRVITFGTQDGADLFPGAGTDLTSATELTATLFKSVLGPQFNARLDHLLRYTLFTLMTAQTMSLATLKRFLTDTQYRMQVCEHVNGYIPEGVTRFFAADFNELRTQYYETTILPLVSMVDEMQLQPSLVGESETSLAKTIQENFLTVFSLNKVSMGEKVVKTVAGLLIQQIFLLAQARVFNQKILLVIDEVSVVQNPALAQILAEARKFNLTVILTQQYFGQVDKDLRDAIFANVYNYYAFKVSEEDARALEGNLNIELPKSVIEAEHAKGIKETEIKVKLMTELDPRQCLVRVISNGQVAPAIKAMTVDAPNARQTARPQNLVATKQSLPAKFVEQDRTITAPKMPKERVAFSKKFMEMLADDSTPKEPMRYQPQQRSYGGLRDLLSLHSSSRTKLNRKDKS